jgi:plasmid stabilization system protein ParE
VRVVFEETASAEYLAGVEFYESARAGSGESFARAIEEALSLLAQHPRIGPRVAGFGTVVEVRQKHIKELSCRLVYVIDDDELRVFAVAHTSRDPMYWRERVASGSRR